ncbi:MAG: dihydrodipicolinate synthase family protein [Armatimonadetes bacterium]|nr:dihydrodipicolinate synthase family protein [Armatimonadota bacterium]
MEARLRGIVTALATPLNRNGSVDAGALRALIDYVVEGGTIGIFALSSTGEGPLLTDEDRQRVIDEAVAAAGGRIAVLVNVSDTSTPRALRWVERAAQAGADYVMATLPFYAWHAGQQILDFYLALADASPLPVLIYNLPEYTNVNVDAAATERLAEHPNIVGVKDSSADWAHFQAVLTVKTLRPDFVVLNGDERALASSVLMGADGGLLGIANIAPRLCVECFEAAARGDVAEARRLQTELTDLCRIYTTADSGHAGVKVALKLIGIGQEWVTPPLRPASEAEQVEVEKILRRHGLL